MKMRDWEEKKLLLAEKQEQWNEKRRTSNKKLKRTRIGRQGIVEADYEIWPAELHILQRIANFMEGIWTPTKVTQRLEKGDKLTTRTGSVYSLVSINSK